MKNSFIFLGAVILLGISAKAQETTLRSHFSFDDTASGALPTAWKGEGTNNKGSAAVWSVTEHSAAKSKPKVLSLTKIAENSRGHFNLAWTEDLQFQNGELEVSVYANTGNLDQGGGPIWRVQDAENYYVARYNPLENNLRIYYVKDGSRKELASADDLDIPAQQWFTIRIVHQASHIEGWVNGEKLLELEDDTIGGAGGVGVWTKDDAVTFFDDVTIVSD